MQAFLGATTRSGSSTPRHPASRVPCPVISVTGCASSSGPASSERRTNSTRASRVGFPWYSCRWSWMVWGSSSRPRKSVRGKVVTPKSRQIAGRASQSTEAKVIVYPRRAISSAAATTSGATSAHGSQSGR